MPSDSWYSLAKPIIADFEGLVLTAYDDLQPKKKISKPSDIKGTLTIGYGHTGPDVTIGMKITEEEADAFLRQDVAEAEDTVNGLVTVPISAMEKAALVSFTFNVGAYALKKSTLLRKLNAGDRHGAGAEFHKWNKSKGRVLAGLVRRRNAEAALFMNGVHASEAVEEVGSVDVIEDQRGVSKRIAGTAAIGTATVVASQVQEVVSVAGGVSDVISPESGSNNGIVVILIAALVALGGYVIWTRWKDAQNEGKGFLK